MTKLKPIAHLTLSAILILLTAASIVAMVRALLVQNTLAAVESALGTAVLALILGIAAIKLFKSGWRQLHGSREL